MKKLMLVTLIAGSLFAAVGCAKKNSSNGGGKPTDSDGTSSGGGGFGDENSMLLLNWTKKVVAAYFRQSNPDVFAGLPPGWTAERLARLIENTHAEPNKVVYRYGRELMFDYKIPKSGEPYLIATSLYFRAHSAIPVNSLWPTQKEPYIRELRMKLLHEAAHVLGFGLSEKTDIKARAFAIYLTTQVFPRNNVVCSTKDVPDNYPARVTDEKIETEIRESYKDQGFPEDYVNSEIEKGKARKYYWYLSRPTGFGLQVLKEPNLRKGTVTEIQRWYKQLHEGSAEASFSSFAYFPGRHKDPNFRSGAAELSREYEAPQFSSNERLLQQYYKNVEIDRKSLVFTGVMETSDGDKKCEIRESIKIPQGKTGDYVGKLEFVDTCPFDGSTGEFKGETLKVSFNVECKEVLRPIGNLTQFMDGQPLEDKYLLEWDKTREDLD